MTRLITAMETLGGMVLFALAILTGYNALLRNLVPRELLATGLGMTVDGYYEIVEWLLPIIILMFLPIVTWKRKHLVLLGTKTKLRRTADWAVFVGFSALFLASSLNLLEPPSGEVTGQVLTIPDLYRDWAVSLLLLFSVVVSLINCCATR